MPHYEYKATNNDGQAVVNTMVAASRKAAIDQLFAEGLHPSLVIESDGSVHSSRRVAGRVSKADVESFTRELGNLLAAGISLSQALKILARESTRPANKELWTKIHDNVSNGTSLSDTLRQWPRYFSSVYTAMVRAGETGGFLELVLEQIADFGMREKDLKSRVQAALVYPIILSFLAALILVFLLIYFIPRFSSIFAEFGGTLPALTQWIVAASNGLIHYWLIVVGAIVAAIIGIRKFLERDQGQAVLERMMLEAPLLGPLTSRFAFVRFSRMLGTLLNAGVPLLSALQVAREAIGNQTLAVTVDSAAEKVRKGMSLSQGLRECPELFSGANIEMIAVAEESSRLGEELTRLAEVNEKELDRHLKTAVSFAEPLMLFAMAALVGTIVIGMLLPIFNLQELIH